GQQGHVTTTHHGERGTSARGESLLPRHGCPRSPVRVPLSCSSGSLSQRTPPVATGVSPVTPTGETPVATKVVPEARSDSPPTQEARMPLPRDMYMRLGSQDVDGTGKQVTQIQTALNLAMPDRDALTVSGFFDNDTDAAVREFQRRVFPGQFMEADGI